MVAPIFIFEQALILGETYQPTVTSYDDAALLNEYGDYTPAYFKVRELLHHAQNLPMKRRSAPPKATTHRECSANALCAAVGKLRPDWPAASHTASGEHGALWPEFLAIFSIAKSWRAIITAQTLFVEGVHDIAYLRINGKVVKRI